MWMHSFEWDVIFPEKGNEIFTSEGLNTRLYSESLYWNLFTFLDIFPPN